MTKPYVSIHCDDSHDDYKIVAFERGSLGWVELDWYQRDGELDQQLRQPQAEAQPADIVTQQVDSELRLQLRCRKCQRNLTLRQAPRIAAFRTILDRLVDANLREVTLLTIEHLLQS